MECELFKLNDKQGSLQESELESSAEMQLRVWDDVTHRTKPGILTYSILWPIIAYGSGFYDSHFALSWIVEIVFIVSSFWRFFQIYYLSHWKIEYPRLWVIGLFCGVLVHGLGWSLMFGYSLFIDNPSFSFFMGFSSAGVVAGGTNSFAPLRKLANSFIITFTLPPIFAAIYIGDQWVMVSLISMFMLYTFNLAKLQNREYWHSLVNELILEKQSLTDSLTSLHNRRFFDEKLKELCNLASRNQTPIAVLVIDIDHFKTINDELGHDFGDESLRQLASIFKTSVPRTTDICARYGGEEFSVILPNTDTACAELVAERIRSQVEAHTIKFNDKEARLTVSIGLVSRQLTTFEVNIPTLLFKRADEALYLAKEQGRNRIVTSDNCTKY